VIGLEARWAFVLLPALAVGCGDEAPQGGGADAARAYRPLRDMATYTSPEDAQTPDVEGAGGTGAVDADPAGGSPADAAPVDDAAPPEAEDAGAPPEDLDAERPPRPIDAEPPEPEPDAAVPPPRPDAAVPPGPVVPEACQRALDAARFDFEAGPQGFGHRIMDDVEANWPLDPWEHGRATVGPGACVDGGRCWATGLDENLVQCQRAELRSPAIDLDACAGQRIEMVFDHWYAFWAGTDGFSEWYDGGTVEAGTIGEFFEVLAPEVYPGTIAINPSIGFGYSCVDANNFYVDGLPGFVLESDGWEEVRMPLGRLAGAGPFAFRFAYATGVSAETRDPDESQALSPPGWFIDRIRFEVR